MTRRRDGLLTTESRRDCERHRRKFIEQIVPIGAIEEEYVDDFARSRRGIHRLERIEAGILNKAFPEAVENLLKQLLPPEDFKTHLDREKAAEDLARRYFGESKVRAYVLELLRKAKLDEAAIEAEAFCLCASELDLVHRMMAFKQDSSEKNLFMLGQMRQGALRCLQPTSKPEPENAVPTLIARRGG